MSIKKGVENKPTSIPSEIESILLKTKLLSFLKVYLLTDDDKSIILPDSLISVTNHSPKILEPKDTTSKW